MSSIPKEVTGHCLSYLPNPEAVATVSKSMKEAVPYALAEWSFPSSSWFLNKIRDGLIEKIGQPIGMEGAVRRGRTVRKTAIETIQKAATLLSDAQWAEKNMDPKSYAKGSWDFDQMATEIARIRLQNLINFFCRLSETPGAEAFTQRIVHGDFSLFSLRKAFREESHELDSVTQITPFIDSKRAPVEILQLRNLEVAELGRILNDACLSGNLEIVQGILRHPRFNQIPIYLLACAYQMSLNKGYQFILDAFDKCSRFSEIEPEQQLENGQVEDDAMSGLGDLDDIDFQIDVGNLQDFDEEETPDIVVDEPPGPITCCQRALSSLKRVGTIVACAALPILAAGVWNWLPSTES